jgi:hypothetical protein
MSRDHIRKKNLNGFDNAVPIEADINVAPKTIERITNDWCNWQAAQHRIPKVVTADTKLLQSVEQKFRKGPMGNSAAFEQDDDLSRWSSRSVLVRLPYFTRGGRLNKK